MAISSDSEWRYVPIRRISLADSDGDIAGNFHDTADGETSATTTGHHTGGVNLLMGDGSVRSDLSLSPESLQASDEFRFDAAAAQHDLGHIFLPAVAMAEAEYQPQQEAFASSSFEAETTPGEDMPPDHHVDWLF